MNKPARRVPADDRLLDRTLEVFQPRTSRRLTREDARQMHTNLADFFDILLQWDRAERAAAGAAR